MRKSLAKSAKTFYIPHKSPQGDKYGKKICTTDSISLSIKSRINGQAEYASGCRFGRRAVTQAGAGPDTEQRFINIEMALSDLERTVEDLNDVIIRQGRDIAFLQKQNRFLTEALRNAQSTVKPLEEETPPPHY